MDFTNRSQQIAAGSQDEASRISDLIVSEVIEIMMIDDIFELHRSAKTGNLSLVDDFLVVTRETTVNGSHVRNPMLWGHGTTYKLAKTVDIIVDIFPYFISRSSKR